MQALRLTSVRRLCLSVTASVARRPQNALPSVLLCRTTPFTASSTRWYSGIDQLKQQVTERAKEEENYDKTEEDESAPPKVKSATNTLYIGNLPYSTTDQELREIFSVYGPLSRVLIARDGEDKSMGYAHIDFESKQDAIRATKDHNESPIMIGERNVRMDYAHPFRPKGPAPPRRGVKDRHKPSPTVFIGNIPFQATKEDIREALEPLGDVTAIRLSPGKDRPHAGFAHVDFMDTSEAEKVLKHYQHNPIQILDREIRMDRSSSSGMAYPPSPRLYFTGWEGNTSSLRSHFRALRSKIVDVRLFANSDPNVLVGSGFVEFCDLEAAREALLRFATPELALSYARPSHRSKSRPAARGDRGPTTFGLKPAGGRDRNNREW